MTERRRIRLAAIPIQEEAEKSVPKPKKLRVKVTVDATSNKTLSPRKKTKKSSRKAIPLVEKGKRIIARSIDATGMISHYQEQRDPEEQKQRETIQVRIRDSILKQTNIRVQEHHFANLGFRSMQKTPKAAINAIDSIESSSSYGSCSLSESLSADSSTASASSSSTSESAGSFASSSSASGSKPDNLALEGDSTFDTYGSNSIVADETFKIDGSSSMLSDASSTLPSETSTYQSETTAQTGMDSLWGVFQTLIGSPKSNAEVLKKKSKIQPRNTGEMEMLLEVDSSDSWIESIHTNSDESFDAALNKELDYHRHTSDDPSWGTIHDRVRDTLKVNSSIHEKKPIAELSDAEFLEAIRQALDADTSSTTGKTPPTANLSNAEFLQVMRQSMNGETKTETNTVSAAVQPTKELSNADLSKPLHQSGVEMHSAKVAMETELSNADFMKALRQHGADDNDNFEPEPVELLDELANDEFLQAMRQSLKVEGGQFTENHETVSALSHDDFMNALHQHGVDDRDHMAQPSTELSNSDFLQAMRQTTLVNNDSLSSQSPSDREVSNSQFLDALRQMVGVSHGGLENVNMFGFKSKLETIEEVDSCLSNSTHATPSTSPKTSLAIQENNVVDEILNENVCAGNGSAMTNPEIISIGETKGIEIESVQLMVAKVEDEIRQQASPVSVKDKTEMRSGEILVTKDKGVDDSNDMPPDLQCVSSDESDTQFDPQPVADTKHGKEESWTEFHSTFTKEGEHAATNLIAADDEITNFLSAADEADTNFLSAMDDSKMWRETEIGSYDSLDEFFNEAYKDEQSISGHPCGTVDNIEAEATRNDETNSDLENLIGFWEEEKSEPKSKMCVSNSMQKGTAQSDESTSSGEKPPDAPVQEAKAEPTLPEDNALIDTLIPPSKDQEQGECMPNMVEARSDKTPLDVTEEEQRESLKLVAEPSENDEPEWKAPAITDIAEQISLDACEEEIHRALEVTDIPAQTSLDASEKEKTPCSLEVADIPEQTSLIALEEETPEATQVPSIDYTEEARIECSKDMEDAPEDYLIIESSSSKREHEKQSVSVGDDNKTCIEAFATTADEFLNVSKGIVGESASPEAQEEKHSSDANDVVTKPSVVEEPALDTSEAANRQNAPGSLGTAESTSISPETEKQSVSPQCDAEEVTESTSMSPEPEKQSALPQNDAEAATESTSVLPEPEKQSISPKNDDAADRKARNDLIRAVYNDATLGPEEKKTLIQAIVEGAPIEEPSIPTTGLTPSSESSLKETSEISVAEIDTEAPKDVLLETKNSDPLRDEKNRDLINKEIGKKMIEGWTVLDASCPDCALPLLTDTQANNAICVLCGFCNSILKDDGSKINALPPPAPPSLPPNKKSRTNRKNKKRQSAERKLATMVCAHPVVPPPLDESREVAAVSE
jgi:uncharacterized Zn finger protein (UPF0148 family)